MKPSELKARYEQGENITSLLREQQNVSENSDRIIELAYDLQSGTYVGGIKSNPEEDKACNAFITEVMEIVLEYKPKPFSALKGGVGESITLVPMLQGFGASIPKYVHGFDMCWSRMAFGRKWLAENGFHNVQQSMGTLSEIPFTDNSFDIVLTSHSVEPNGGREKEILQELFRVAGSYLFLAEPCYELGSPKAKERMERLGYIKNLEQTARDLGYNVLENRPIKNVMNPLNPTSLLIIHKDENCLPEPEFACPQSKTKVEKYESCYYSSEYLAAYPILEGIPCLRSSYAIVASKLPETTRQS